MENKNETRVRYAPSPTGLQHIGGVRTALFNYLFARAGRGKFILRLEDTDRTRSEQRFVDNLYDTFSYLGFHWDEGPDCGGPFAPYIQSERSALYKEHAAKLLAADKAYYCFCSAERIESVRLEREASHSSLSGYDRLCRGIDRAEAQRRVDAGEPHTVRLKIPLGESTTFTDKLLGDVTWNNDVVNPDPVLLKTDGFPTYHLANVVDDHLMGITHVLRAQEWLSSTPLHIIIYNAFAWTPPEFCHLPMVMGQDGKKLSKRHGATSVDEFVKAGYVNSALGNYVATLGASYMEGKEIYTLDELAANFSIKHLNASPAVFDYKKLDWYNSQYIQRMSDDELVELALPFAIDAGLFGAPAASPTAEQKKLFADSMPLIKERAVLLSDIPPKLAYLFSEPPLPARETFVGKKSSVEEAARLLKFALEYIPLLAGKSDTEAEEIIKDFAAARGEKIGSMLMPLRIALTGSAVSPPLFASIRLLGQSTALRRTRQALECLG